MQNQLTRSELPEFSILFVNHQWHSNIISFLVGILMLSLYFWITAGFINLLMHLYHYALVDWQHGAEMMIKEVVIMLAALELIRTLQSYLVLGRVKVTFILDAALVVLIGELISLWYREYVTSEVIVNLSVISVLTLLRIITSKYSPDCTDDVMQ